MIAPSLLSRLHPRQIVHDPPATTTAHVCPEIPLPAGGIIHFKNSVLTLDTSAVYRPNCSTFEVPVDPFYASTTVFVYVIATTTAIAWMLLIILLTTQRAPNAERAPKSTGWLQARGVARPIAGRTPLGGFGHRPWLQKTALLLVTLGLTVASVDTFGVARIQHSESLSKWMRDAGLGDPHPGMNTLRGLTYARMMRDYVVGSTEIRVFRVVSGVFVWLAQVQTLIRLFPRRKEKLIIKWFGFSLIICDLIFSCLNSFWLRSQSLPGSYQDAISALNYLFQLSISLLYAAWVLYYVATKRRYAFFRPSELNMSIIALLALVSIAIPVAFFISDISVPAVAGWGDFFRWAGAAAASVMVWEWVDRIEAVEREEKKDGILGREVFDEDELPKWRKSTGSSEEPSTTSDSSARKPSSKTFGSLAARYVRGYAFRKQLRHVDSGITPSRQLPADRAPEKPDKAEELGARVDVSTNASRAQSPPNRHETTSVGSTVYAVHYHPIEPTPPITAQIAGALTDRENHGAPLANQDKIQGTTTEPEANKRRSESATKPVHAKLANKVPSSWAFTTNAFKRRKRSPPLEIKNAMQHSGDETYQQSSAHQAPRFDFRGRILQFGASRGDQSAGVSLGENTTQQQPTIIPAPPRGQTWSPDVWRHSPDALNYKPVSNNVATGAILASVERAARHQNEQSAVAPIITNNPNPKPNNNNNSEAVAPPNTIGETGIHKTSNVSAQSSDQDGQASGSDSTAVESSGQISDDTRPDPG